MSKWKPKVGRLQLFVEKPGSVVDDSTSRTSDEKDFTMVINDLINKVMNPAHFLERLGDGVRVVQWAEIETATALALELFKKEPALLRINAPVVIVGPLHGEVNDIHRLFGKCGLPSDKRNFLFLGNYVDRGLYGVEVTALLLSFKIKYPANVFLLRGKHEFAAINAHYGLRDECLSKYDDICFRHGEKVFKSLNDAFAAMPLAAVVDGKIFCAASGIPSRMTALDEINQIPRPLGELDGSLVSDLLWSEYEPCRLGFAPNVNKPGYLFGDQEVKRFCERLRLSSVVLGGKISAEGYTISKDGLVVTVFSVSNYANEFRNGAAVVHVQKSGRVKVEIISKPREP